MLIPSRFPGGRITHLLANTALAAFIVWLNEGYGIRKLRAARKEAESLIQEREQ
jgi:hypothetical protein